ncbi:hypothetical protein HYALB_00011740 [Hymenoscyphus albidus]|uniref:Uncharacterized protein n=1 Tax=Hymenoscyphus albidus TaxID=595503 RepID=A0A9N9LNM8_9HELO|nr:hypothetical protein HYALB_00011740 [Hymenoscyphus albidus]
MVRLSNPLKFGTDIWDPSHRFETSWLLSPWALFACRAAISLYAFATIFFIMGWEGGNHDGLSVHDIRKSFSFFTVLCYWGAAFYFLAAAIHTFSYALNGGTPLLNRLPRPLQALHYLFYSTITTFPFLVTIVYWAVIFPSNGAFTSTFGLWSNVSQHALNAVFALFELLLTRVNPQPWIHLLFLIFLLIGYLGVAYITYATKGYYVYGFLDPRPRQLNAQGRNVGGVGKVGVVGYVLGIAVAILVIFCISKGVAWVRKWASEKKLGMTGKFYGGRDGRQGEVELEAVRIWEK